MPPSRRWEVWAAPLAGGPARKVAEVAGSYYKVSPDGRYLKTSRALCDLPGCTNQRPVPIGAGQPTHGWTPSGEIAFLRDGNIWSQSLDGGASHAVTHVTAPAITSFAWSPDGKRLAVTRGVMFSDIVLVKGIH